MIAKRIGNSCKFFLFLNTQDGKSTFRQKTVDSEAEVYVQDTAQGGMIRRMENVANKV